MQLSAQCPRCRKDYTAPPSFSGRAVKCKECGSIFTLPGEVEDESASLHANDQDTESALLLHGESSFAKNLSRMDATGAAEIPLTGLSRDSFRRTTPWPFAGSVEIEKFVPPALVILCTVLLMRAALSGDDVLSVGMQFGRVASIVIVFFGIFWPITVIGVRTGLINAKVVQPSEFPIKVLGSFSIAAVAIMGLWIVGDGGAMTLVFGTAIGIAISLPLIFFFMRLEPKEISPVLAHAAVGAIIAAAVAIGALCGVNAFAKSVTRGFKTIDTIPASPIAYKMSWPKSAPSVGANRPTLDITTRPTTQPIEDFLADIFVTHRAEVPGLNFSYMILPATPSGVVALVNDRVTPPTLEIWSTRPWKRLSGPTKVYRQFKRSTYAISPDGQVLSRLTDLPRFGLETVTSLGQPYRALAEFSNPELEHELIGMPSASRAVLRMNSADGKASIKIVSLGEGAENYEFEVGSLPPLILEPKCQAISLLPDGIGFAVAGRDESGSAAVMIHRFEPMRTQRLALSLNKRLKIAPLALTASADNTQIALLISADGELLLFTWLLPKTSGGSIFDVENLPTYEYIPGSEQFIRGNFTGQNPLLWLDDQTILLFGRLVLDVETGISLQTIAEPNITSVIDWDGQTLSLLKNDSAVVTLKLNLSALRK